MNRVCLTKTGKLIEMQSGGKVDRSFNDVCNEENQIANNKKWDELEALRLDTLKQNALNAGYKEDEIDVKWVTDDEWAKIQEANKPVPTTAQLRAAEYPTIQECIEAIIEKYEENRPEKMTAIQARRMAVKEKYPKG